MELTPTRMLGAVALSVSELAELARISAHSVRYYGRLGLLPASGRTSAGHRYYEAAALERLRFIKGAQWLDLSLDEIGELLRLWDTGTCPCGRAEPMLRRRIAAIDQQVVRLQTVRQVLCGLLGADAVDGSADHGPTRAGPETLEEATRGLGLDSPLDGAVSCGCCQAPPPPSREEEIEELRARLAAVECRLRNVGFEKPNVGEQEQGERS